MAVILLGYDLLLKVTVPNTVHMHFRIGEWKWMNAGLSKYVINCQLLLLENVQFFSWYSKSTTVWYPVLLPCGLSPNSTFLVPAGAQNTFTADGIS